MTLLLLRNNYILFHQSSNLIWLPSNYPGSKTMLFSIMACLILLCTTSASAVDIFSDASSVVLFLSKAYSSVILNDFNIYSSISMLIVSYLYLFILSVHDHYHNSLCLSCIVLSVISTTIVLLLFF